MCADLHNLFILSVLENIVQTCANICTDNSGLQKDTTSVSSSEGNVRKAAKMWKRIVAAEHFELPHARKAHLLQLLQKMQKMLCSNFWLKGLEWILAGSADHSAKLGVNIDIQQHTAVSKYTFL